MSNDSKDTIFIGKKPLMTYVTSTIVQLATKPNVTIKARGLTTAIAIDVAQVVLKKTKPAFAIDNVQFLKVLSSRSPFDTVMNGWSCGAITTCGSLGKVCGGYGKRGRGSDIRKRFSRLTIGETYTIKLDFIRIDSWDSEWGYVTFDGATL